MKLGCWNQNPWGLFALGHHDLDTVRLCMKACLEFYQVETLDKGGASSSQLEFLLCHPGTVGYSQMCQFINGAPFQDLPFLKRMRGRCMFALSSDRWVEARHAMERHWLGPAHNAGPVHVAFFSSMPALRSLLVNRRSDDRPLQELAVAGAHCSNSERCLQQMGMMQHPSISHIKERLGGLCDLRQKQRSFAIRVLYHADARTLYRPLSIPEWHPWQAPPPPPPPPGSKPGGANDDDENDGGDPPPPPSSKPGDANDDNDNN